ncbi:hypothetical protein IR145_09970, partial [Streptococcus danieliae]|nr:hypothetical protein [Streptococcus danieliae]
FVEPSISTTSLDVFDDENDLEEEVAEEIEVTDEIDEHRASEDDETEIFDGGFTESTDIASKFSIDSEEESF